MSTLERPRLRPGLEAVADQRDPRHVYLIDPLRISPRPHRLSLIEFACVQLFDGQRSLGDIHSQAARATGATTDQDQFVRLVERLDLALLLDGPHYRRTLSDPIRQPSCLGCYEADERLLRKQIYSLFTHPSGAGLPGKRRRNNSLRAVLVPHIDYQRGGTTYTWGFRELFERSTATLFVIIGTSHYSSKRFTLTRKDFKTPLGIARTDQGFVDRLVHHYGSGLFDDEAAHLPEHSIELEVVFLQYLFGDSDFRIVPLLAGTFDDCVLTGESPLTRNDVAKMIHSLEQAEHETGHDVCYVISGDLAHIGPSFGDTEPANTVTLAHSQCQDRAILRQAESADHEGFFQTIAAEKDRRRICGLPPTYTALAATKPARGRVLNYAQHVHPRGLESVSFASVAFDRA